MKWNRSNGTSIVRRWDLKATKVQATACLQLEAGALDYNIFCDPFTNWEANRYRVTLEDFESDSSNESIGQNFCSSYPIMKPINIFAWNVRGAGNPEFRRVFMGLMARHKPNVVLLTET